ncbi:hemerythrin/HHE cation-binding motif [Penicillium digitatum]|uniref:Hemerythrin/HHE cation-binding motif n=1 Tax=Penicillium digitatum TaxID=36651 RepID=A0A7T6XM59_PENDI|nr:hemerythrin/HHE cation-binding motif [Penicillium digitatum]
MASSPRDLGDSPLSASDFRTYNRMEEQMEGFHNHFRLTWNQLWKACGSSGKRGLSARQVIMMGLQFCSQLDFHHSIEEQHIFPVLAKKMPEFRKELELLSQHSQIHAGIEKLENNLDKCRSGSVDIFGPRGSTSWSCQHAQILVSCRDVSASYVMIKNTGNVENLLSVYRFEHA